MQPTFMPGVRPTLATLALTAPLPDQQMRLHSRSAMVRLSHLIEEHAALAGPETILIASFQRLRLFERQIERYKAFAPRVARIYALGVADVPIPALDGVVVVPIEPGWPLAQEWSVIARGPKICAALLTRAVGPLQPDQRSRRFRGLWTTDQTRVDSVVNAFFAAINQPTPALTYDPTIVLEHTQALQRALAQQMHG